MLLVRPAGRQAGRGLLNFRGMLSSNSSMSVSCLSYVAGYQAGFLGDVVRVIRRRLSW